MGLFGSKSTLPEKSIYENDDLEEANISNNQEYKKNVVKYLNYNGEYDNNEESEEDENKESEEDEDYENEESETEANEYGVNRSSDINVNNKTAKPHKSKACIQTDKVIANWSPTPQQQQQLDKMMDIDSDIQPQIRKTKYTSNDNDAMFINVYLSLPKDPDAKGSEREYEGNIYKALFDTGASITILCRDY